MTHEKKPCVGWREWIYFPDLGGFFVKAKTDTGARTSALHAYFIEPFDRDGTLWVRFGLHPVQGSTAIELVCEAPVFDRRQVTDSGGHKEERYVIQTRIQINNRELISQLTLTNRDTMRFRMLLGRNTLNHHFTVDPALSFLAGGNSQNPPVLTSEDSIAS